MRWITYDAGNGIRTGILDADDTVQGLAPGNTLLGLIRSGAHALDIAAEHARQSPRRSGHW